ncbi:MAG: hypothetical protein HQL52_03130 [Magnetococcales bacterium]|nr:hypothetical protein [Magnetococcales bacterium]
MLYKRMIMVTVAQDEDWDIANAAYASKQLSTASQDADISGLFLGDDGTKGYVTGKTNDKVFQYTLSTPWDISTASYASKSLSVSSQDSSPRNLFFKPDGSVMYLSGGSSRKVYQYSLSTPWDVSTASYASKFKDLSTEGGGLLPGIFIKSDGIKMYLVGVLGDAVFQYTLSTPWDVSSASYDSQSFSVISQDTIMEGLFFSPSGAKMFCSGRDSDKVYQYTLETPWDISTASYDSVSVSVLSQDDYSVGLTFRPDGSSFYIVGSQSKKIHQYTT